MDFARKLKPFRTQSESFTVLRDEGCYYVDKTDFIRYLIEKGDKICVVTRPRRFGKTLMLRTLETFFEYRLDDDGKPVDNRRYFEGLKVMEAGDNVLAEMGQYPVISVSFKDVWADAYDKVLGQMRGAVCTAIEPYTSMLKNSGVLSEGQLGTLQRYLDRIADETELTQFLQIVTAWLYRATKRRSVILLDEYDVPLQKAAIHDMHDPNNHLFDQTVNLVGRFISCGFKSNNYLAYGIIAGCMRVAKESIFTGMNNPGVITVLDRIPDEYWGFTQPEVEKMLAYYGLSDKMDALKNWYEGYYYSDREVYNPWSLLNAIRGLVNGYGKDAIQSYWVRTSGNDIIDDMIQRNPDHRNKLAQIMNGEPLWAPVFQDLSYRDVQTHPDAIWSFLLYTGYLKAIEKRQLETGNWEARVTIPNMEIRSVMNQAMEHWWKDIKLAHYDVRPLMQALWKGDVPAIEREMNGIMNDSISVKDAKEDFYHGMLVGVLRTQSEVKSNRESGEGYPDIVAIDGNHAAILELKCLLSSALDKLPLKERYVRAPELMEKLLDEAEEQIRTRYYIEGLRFEKPLVTDIKSYAVCFCRKRCMVREVHIEQT